MLQLYYGPTCNTGWQQNDDDDDNDEDCDYDRDERNFGLWKYVFCKTGDQPSLSRFFKHNSVSLYSPNSMYICRVFVL